MVINVPRLKINHVIIKLFSDPERDSVKSSTYSTYKSSCKFYKSNLGQKSGSVGFAVILHEFEAAC